MSLETVRYLLEWTSDSLFGNQEVGKISAIVGWMTWHFFHLHLNQPKQTGPQGMPIRLAAMHTCGNMCSLCNDITKRLAVQVCRVCVENSRLTESWETIRGKLVHVPWDVKPQMLRLVDTRIIFRYSKYQSRGHDVVRHHIHTRTHTLSLSLFRVVFVDFVSPLWWPLLAREDVSHWQTKR